MWKKFLCQTKRQLLIREMYEDVKYRRYRVQSNWEPRIHTLYHADGRLGTSLAGDAGPGYRYGAVTMMARPLWEVPQMQQLAKDIAQTCLGTDGNDKENRRQDGCPWNIGVHPVFYRNGLDRIGAHADDDQGETLIVSAIVLQDRPRKLVIRPKQMRAEEKVELLLGAGDVYEMDGEMQKWYTHELPPLPGIDPGMATCAGKRMSIVLRRGVERKFTKDNGEDVEDLLRPLRKPYSFGPVRGIEYGGVYRRRDLHDSGAFLGQQRNVSGNEKVGCDSLIISGLLPDTDTWEWDHHSHLMYAASRASGAASLLTSYRENKLVRVFRASSTDPTIVGPITTTYHRYDGLYRIVFVTEPSYESMPYRFHMVMACMGEDGHNNGLKVHSNPKRQLYCPSDFPLRMTKSDYLDSFYNFLRYNHTNLVMVSDEMIGRWEYFNGWQY